MTHTATQECASTLPLQHTSTHCNTQRHTATHWRRQLQMRAITHCNTLRHTATHCNICNTLRCTAAHCNKLQHTATRCNARCDTLQHTATFYNKCRSTPCNTLQRTLQNTITHCKTLQHTATHCSILQHSTIYYNTRNSPQLTATHCNAVFQTCLARFPHRVTFKCLGSSALATARYTCVAVWCSTL